MTDSHFITFPDGAVRLISNSLAPRDDAGGSAGRLEVYQGGEWRNVCNFGFGALEAWAVCRQLGYLDLPHDLISGRDYGTVSDLG